MNKGIIIIITLMTMGCQPKSHVSGGDSSGGGGVSVFAIRVAAQEAVQTIEATPTIQTAGAFDPEIAGVYKKYREDIKQQLLKITEDPEFHNTINDWLLNTDNRRDMGKNYNSERSFYFAFTLAAHLAVPNADATTWDRLITVPALLEKYRPSALLVEKHYELSKDYCAGRLLSSGRKIARNDSIGYYNLATRTTVKDRTDYAGYDYEVNPLNEEGARRNLNTNENVYFHWPAPPEFAYEMSELTYRYVYKLLDYGRRAVIKVDVDKTVGFRKFRDNVAAYEFNLLSGQYKKITFDKGLTLAGYSENSELAAFIKKDSSLFMQLKSLNDSSIDLSIQAPSGFRFADSRIHSKLPIVYIALVPEIESSESGDYFAIYDFNKKALSKVSRLDNFLGETSSGFLIRLGDNVLNLGQFGSSVETFKLPRNVYTVSTGPKNNEFTIVQKTKTGALLNVISLDSAGALKPISTIKAEIKFESDDNFGFASYDTLEGRAAVVCLKDKTIIDFFDRGSK